ncbi:MAG: carbon monoxide dehydrogenase [Acidimicrobiia bacterium]|nr:carbon monoxide dehydrogenase [Acidimicrobiia bacterium]
MSVLPPFGLHRPTTIAGALEAMSFDDMPVAGGTELLLAMRMRVLRPDSLIDLKRIPELQTVEIDGPELVIGGGVTHQQAADHPLVEEHTPILPPVLLEVGNPRVRASGTLAGNLVFAEPKSDVIPILLALDASVVLVSASATRSLTIDEFILGPYYSAREPDELLTQIRIPLGRVSAAVYLKYQTMERPTVGVAALDISLGDGPKRRVVVGAACELPVLRDFAPGERIDAAALAAELDIVPDMAGNERYKRHVTAIHIDRALARLDESPVR